MPRPKGYKVEKKKEAEMITDIVGELHIEEPREIQKEMENTGTKSHLKYYILLDENNNIIKEYRNVSDEDVRSEYEKIKRIEISQGRDKYKLAMCTIDLVMFDF